MAYDLIIRSGTIVDGLGGQPYVGDVAVQDGVIAALGAVAGDAVREIDATGLLVTPGFVDVDIPGAVMTDGLACCLALAAIPDSGSRA
jgi:N-acyl-D-aspartate/D-glutamate deacylase